MTIYQTIKTIEEAENILKEKYNIDSFGPRPDSDGEYFSQLMKEIIKKEDEVVSAIFEEILRGSRCLKG